MRPLLPTLLLGLALALPARAEMNHGEMDHAGMNPTGMDHAAMRTEGLVRKIDRTQGKLTLRHGPLENLGMPAMTMVFRVGDPVWLEQLKIGDNIRFQAERVNGKLTVTQLEVVQ